MNSLSSHPFSKMCHSIPHSTAMSVPERIRTYSVACAAVRVKRGSMTIRFARLISLPARMCCTEIGCGGVAAHDDHGLGVAQVVIGVRLRAVAPGIGHAGNRGRMADASLM